MKITEKFTFCPALLAGDYLVILLFVFIGQRDHDMDIVASLPSLFMISVAVILPWAAAAIPLGVMRLPDSHTAAARWSWFGRVAAAWLIAAPLGVVIRALVRNLTVIPVAFLLVMLGLGVISILAWRALVYVLTRRRTAAQPPLASGNSSD